MRKRYITKTFLKRIDKELKAVIKDSIGECDVDWYLLESFKESDLTLEEKQNREIQILAERYTMMYLNQFKNELGSYFDELREELGL